MPIIQELLGVPSTGGLIGKALGEGIGGGFSAGLQQSISEFNAKKQNRNSLAGLQPLLKQAGFDLSPEENEQLLASGLNPELVARSALDLHKQRSVQEMAQQKAMADREAQEQKLLADQKELMQKGKTYKSIMNKMQELKPYVGTTMVPFTKSAGGHIPYTEAAKKRANINTLRLSLEGLFRDLTLKGQFPKAIYERILEELPTSEDSEKVYQGKLDAVNQLIEAHFGQSDMAEGFEEGAPPKEGKRMSLEEIFG